jgi:hypothetical protein
MVWPWSLSPLPPQPYFAPVKGAKGRSSETITIKARRENRKPKLAVSRTERSGYAQSAAAVAHASVKAAIAAAQGALSFRRHFAAVSKFLQPRPALARTIEAAKVGQRSGLGLPVSVKTSAIAGFTGSRR